MLRPRILRLVFLLIALLGCDKVAPPSSQNGAESVVRARSQALTTAEAQRDVGKILDFWSEEAVIYLDKSPPRQGRDQIRAVYQGWLPLAREQQNEIIEIVASASGDLAYERGNTYTTWEADGPTPSGTASKYLAVWQRSADGQWRISAFSATSNP
ncbi:MAG TPA: DUF4440 domain-containing protein [Thermoanaerobaculia bacterium]|nr:DUF4440 domain-containing protein [Thermoanaerobaculia bacterium]